MLTLAIGIGANTAIYAAVDALLLRSLPFRDPARLMDLVLSTPDEGTTPWSHPRYVFFRAAQQSYQSLAIHKTLRTTIAGGDSERTSIEEVSTDCLRTPGIAPSRGHDFARDDVAFGARKVALISDALWQRRFNADPEVVGKIP